MVKICTECRENLPLSAFNKSKLGKYGHMSQCRDCRNKKYYRTEKGRAARARYMRERRANDPEFVIRQAELSKAPHRRYAKRDYQVLRQYGLNPEDLARLYDAQDRKCAGCGRSIDLQKNTHIDHDHVTGLVRGILCRGCNVALGAVHDSPETLRSLVHYLASAERS